MVKRKKKKNDNHQKLKVITQNLEDVNPLITYSILKSFQIVYYVLALIMQ